MKRTASKVVTRSTFFVAMCLCGLVYMYFGGFLGWRSQLGLQKSLKFEREEKEPILCRNQTRFGGMAGGGKEVCLDGTYKPSAPCIVYSFGSNFNFGFDLDAHNYLGCDVYTYDPSMDVKSEWIPTEVKFFSVGLAGRDYVTEKQWPMKSLESILKDNNHTNKIIDILKMDIEGSEWDSIPNIMESGLHKQIKQMLIEVHAGHRFGNPEGPYWEMLMLLSNCVHYDYSTSMGFVYL